MKCHPLFFLLFFFLFTFSATAQTLKGVVLDAKTNEPLPYVHIGVLDKNIGVISNDIGEFGIDLSETNKADEIVFSILGYEVQKKKVTEVSLTSNITIQLIQNTQQLKEVIVRAEKSKPIKLGRFTPSNTTIGHSRKDEFGLGGEWGLRIYNKGKKYWIDNVQFHMRFNTVDSILFRIQMYFIKEDMPDQSLIAHEIFVTSYSNQHWIVKNLEPENLVMDQDVIVSYEVVRVWFSKKSDNEIFFTYGKGYEEGKIYSRASSQDRWKINQPSPAAIPVAMFLTVSEY